MELQLAMPVDKKSDSVWDDYVPIIKSGRHTTVYLTDAIEAPCIYNELTHVLGAAYTGDTFTLHINNGGGAVDSAFYIVDAMVKCKAKIRVVLSGTVASSATLIALHADEMEIADYTQWLSHNYSAGVAQSKGFELKTYVAFNDRELNVAFRKIHAGFLTDDEINGILEDRDVWLTAGEVRERWAKFKGISQKKVK